MIHPWIGFPKRASIEMQEFDHEDEEPHRSWRETYANLVMPAHRGAETRMAFKDPLTLLGAKAILGHMKVGSEEPSSFARLAKLASSSIFRTSLEEATEKLAQVREELKKASEGAQVYAMTPGALGVDGSQHLGGAPMFQSLASMQMRPTLGGGFGGFGPYGGFGGDVPTLINSYKAMAGGAGAPVGW